MAKEKKIPFYKRKELWGAVALFGLFGMQFPSHTIMHKAGIFANGAVGIAITWFGIKKGHESGNLPSGLSKVIEKFRIKH
jgi:hypothetical protein